MTKIEVIEALIVKTSDKKHPNKYLSFDRPVIEAALELLEKQYDI